MTDSEKVLLLVLVVAAAVLVGSLYWLHVALQPAIEHIEQHGLKEIFESIWCGQEGCDSQDLDQ